jgi:hypothetical protein
MGWGACERALKLHLSQKGLSGKVRAKTGIGKSDLPGLQGGPRKRDFVLRHSARASALSRLSAYYPVGTVDISGDGTGELLTNIVVRELPFHFTTEPETKPVPLTVR